MQHTREYRIFAFLWTHVRHKECVGCEHKVRGIDDDRQAYEGEDPATLFEDEPPRHCYPPDALPGLFASAAERMNTPLAIKGPCG